MYWRQLHQPFPSPIPSSCFAVPSSLILSHPIAWNKATSNKRHLNQCELVDKDDCQPLSRDGLEPKLQTATSSTAWKYLFMLQLMLVVRQRKNGQNYSRRVHHFAKEHFKFITLPHVLKMLLSLSPKSDNLRISMWMPTVFQKIAWHFGVAHPIQWTWVAVSRRFQETAECRGHVFGWGRVCTNKFRKTGNIFRLFFKNWKHF